MPALVPTDHQCSVVWLGLVPRRTGPEIEAEALEAMVLSFAGQVGEVHAGLTRPSCSRVTAQHPRGTEIANVRQLSLVSAEEMAQTAARMGVEAIDPLWLGASVVVEGLADFSHLPPSSRLQSQHGVTLVVDMQNRPCHLPALTMRAAGLAQAERFKAAAAARRGVTAWVERPGRLSVGDALRLHVPDQRPWHGGAD